MGHVFYINLKSPPMHYASNDLPKHIQRYRRENQRRLDPRDGVKRLRRARMIQPRGQELPRGEGKEIPNHHHEDRGLDADVPVRVEEVGETGRLLRHGREDDHAVEETDDDPADLILTVLIWRRSGAGVPSEERKTRHADEEAEGDEVEAKFGLVNAVVAPRGVLGRAVCQEAEDGEGEEGAEGGEGV